MTEEEFEERYKRKPVFDDMTRINCDQCGEAGHYLCGICARCGKPRWECGHGLFQAELKLSKLRLERSEVFPENQRATGWFTCDGCDDVMSCEHVYDTWNTEGACLVDDSE